MSMVPDTSEGAGSAGVASALEMLDARSFAQLLRAVRAMSDVPETLTVPLARPTSELTGGPARAELCGLLAGDARALAALRADVTLPAAVHAAIGPRTDAPDATSSGGGAAVRSDATAPEDDATRSVERARALRRTLEEERRRREGAEVRAAAADARAADAEAVRGALEERVVALEGELAAAVDGVRQAVDRSERRSESRVVGLERELATERSAHVTLRRDHDRTRADLAAAQQELVRLQDELDRAPRPVADVASTRPLVLPPELDAGTTEAAGWLARRARHLLVDGYNVTLALRSGHPLEEQRRWLIDRMRPLVSRGGATPVVIFDGDGAAGSRRDSTGVEVRFTAAGVTADDEIVFAVVATSEPVLVVTDDAGLRARVLDEGGNVIGTVHLLGAIDA